MPIPPDLEECPPPEESQECLGDYDCLGTMKCCSLDTCTLTCVPAVNPPEPEVVIGEPGDPGPPGDPVSNKTFHVSA